MYYQKKSDSYLSYIRRKSKRESFKPQVQDDTLINSEDLPFNFKERALSVIDEERIIKILQKQIIFQDVSPEILSVIASEMIIMTLPEGKIVYDLNDEGNFFYIIGKGKVVVNIMLLKKWKKKNFYRIQK